MPDPNSPCGRHLCYPMLSHQVGSTFYVHSYIYGPPFSTPGSRVSPSGTCGGRGRYGRVTLGLGCSWFLCLHLCPAFAYVVILSSVYELHLNAFIVLPQRHLLPQNIRDIRPPFSPSQASYLLIRPLTPLQSGYNNATIIYNEFHFKDYYPRTITQTLCGFSA